MQKILQDKNEGINMAKFYWRDASNNFPNINSIVIAKNIIQTDKLDKPSYCICFYDGSGYYSFETKCKYYPEFWDYIEEGSGILNAIANLKLQFSDKLGVLPA